MEGKLLNGHGGRAQAQETGLEGGAGERKM